MKIAFIALMIAGVAFAQEVKIIPVDKFPSTVSYDGKIYFQASADICVKAGYRLIPGKPTTPEGKRVKSETLVQDDKKADYVKYVIVYEDIPEPVPVVPEILTNVPAEKVVFNFTTNGVFRGVTWLDAPKTNEVRE